MCSRLLFPPSEAGVIKVLTVRHVEKSADHTNVRKLVTAGNNSDSDQTSQLCRTRRQMPTTHKKRAAKTNKRLDSVRVHSPVAESDCEVASRDDDEGQIQHDFKSQLKSVSSRASSRKTC